MTPRPRQRMLNVELIEKVREKVLEEYRKLVETPVMESDITVVTALSDEDIERLVLLALREAKQPLSWREIKQIFSGIAGEDRLRRILNKLKAENVIAELTRTRYSLPQYVPLNELHKVKNPGIIQKIVGSKAEHTQ